MPVHSTQAVAASTFSTLWAPRSARSVTGQMRSTCPFSRAAIQPSSTKTPTLVPAEPAEPEHAAADARGEGGGAGIVGVEHRAVGLRLVREDARLGLDVPLEAAVPVQVIGRDVQHRRHARPEQRGALELEARGLGHDDAVGREVERLLGQAACRCCRRRARGAPGPRKSSPVSAVVVVLPFVPVIAMTSASIARQASSSSPTMGTPRARTRTRAGSVSGTPGLTTTSSAPANASSGWPPVQSAQPSRSSPQRLRGERGAVGGVGGEHGAARRAGSAARRRRRSSRARRRRRSCRRAGADTPVPRPWRPSCRPPHPAASSRRSA